MPENQLNTNQCLALYTKEVKTISYPTMQGILWRLVKSGQLKQYDKNSFDKTDFMKFVNEAKERTKLSKVEWIPTRS